MPSFCPLCGKNKSDEALFCEQCSKKIRADYEVDVPETSQPDSVPEKIDNVQSEYAVNQPISENKFRKKYGKMLLWICAAVAALLLVGGFFLHNNAARQAHLEQVAWENAVRENTIAAYLAFIETRPRNEKIDLARENILELRQLENEEWNRLRQSNSIEELQKFLEENPESLFRSLIINRIDSLKWAETLRIEAQRNLTLETVP
jgi:uncharacterized membrane protein YvbJ